MSQQSTDSKLLHPRVEIEGKEPSGLEPWRGLVERMVKSLPPTLYHHVEAVVLTDENSFGPPNPRRPVLCIPGLLSSVPEGLRGRRSLASCLLAYGLFRAVLGLSATGDEQGSSEAACRSARGASRLASLALDAVYPRHPVVRAVRLACDDDFQRLKDYPLQTWRGALGMLSVLGIALAVGLWNLAAPIVFKEMIHGPAGALWAGNRLLLGLLEVSLPGLFVFRQSLGHRPWGLLAYLWAFVLTNLADPFLGLAAGLGLLSVNLLGLALVGLALMAYFRFRGPQRKTT